MFELLQILKEDMTDRRFKCKFCTLSFMNEESMLVHQKNCLKEQSMQMNSQQVYQPRQNRHNPTDVFSYNHKQTDYGNTYMPQTQSSQKERAKSSAPTASSGVKTYKKNLDEKVIFKRSHLVKEFGTENKHGHLNCFLNVCLQALWQFPKVRADIQMMLTSRDADGCAQIKGFVNSLFDYYDELMIINQFFTQEVPILPALKVRAELFKLYYSQNEFVLHEKADAFEAFDQILGILHSWNVSLENSQGKNLTLNQCLNIECENEQACTIHKNFCQQTISQQVCNICKENSDIEYQSKNLFGITVNTVEILKILAQVNGEKRNSSQTHEESKLIATHEILIEAIQHQMKNQKPGCINGPKSGHKTETIYHLKCSPEIFTFNIAWDGEPLPSKILNFMVAIPERFNSKKLFTSFSQKPESYVLRGVICFQSAHYLAFFRKIFMKMEYLGADFQNLDQSLNQMKSEVGSNNEWTMFDDNNIDNKGSWFEVVKQCVELRTYPTVLFYERIDPNEEEPKIYSKLTPKEIATLLQTSKFQDNEYADFGGGFSQEDIMQQIELEQALKKNKSANTAQAAQVKIEEQKVPASLSKTKTTTSSQGDQKQLTLPELKKKYKEFGIYLFPCNFCSEGLHALHIPKCLNPSCASVNHFQQKDLGINHKMWMQCLLQILKLKGWNEVSVPSQTSQSQISNTSNNQKIEKLDNNEILNQSQIYQAHDTSILQENPLNKTEVNIQVDRNVILGKQSLNNNQAQKNELNLSGTQKNEISQSSSVYKSIKEQNQGSYVHESDKLQRNEEEIKYPDFNTLQQKDARTQNVLQNSQQLLEQYVTPGGPPQQFQNQMKLANQNQVVPQNQVQDFPIDHQKSQFISQFSPQFQAFSPNQKVPVSDNKTDQLSKSFNAQNQASNLNAPLPKQVALIEEEEFIFDAEPLQHQQAQQQIQPQQVAGQTDVQKTIKNPVQESSSVQNQLENPKHQNIESDKVKQEEIKIQKHLNVKTLAETQDYADLNFDEIDEKGGTKVEPPLFLNNSASNIHNNNSQNKFQLQSFLDEMITMWKCPGCKVLVEMNESGCPECQLDLYQYERQGYSLENMIVEVPASKIYEEIQKKSENVDKKKVSSGTYLQKQKKEEQKQTTNDLPIRQTKVYPVNFTQPAKSNEKQNNKDTIENQSKDQQTVFSQLLVSRGANKAVDIPEKKNKSSWQCRVCSQMNKAGDDGCGNCKKNAFEENKQSVKPEPKKDNDIVQWQCTNCQYKNNYYFNVECYKCQKPKLAESLTNQNKASRVQTVVKDLNCTECGKITQSISDNVCIDCKTNQLRTEKLCVDCKKEEKYKNYDKCKSCRLKQLQLEEQNDLRRKLTCGNCKNYKEHESLKVCYACQKQVTEIKNVLHTSACTRCKTKLRHQTLAVCYDCLQELEKLKCKNCKKEKERPSLEFCDKCELQNLETKIKQLKMCTVCKETERYANEQLCISCFRKTQAALCKLCKKNKADSNSKLCARCKFEDNSEKDKKCDRCNNDFFGSGKICGICEAHEQKINQIRNSAPAGKTICRCERAFAEEGKTLCGKCLNNFIDEQYSRQNITKQPQPRQGRPETAQSKKSSTPSFIPAKEQKNLKCPRCKMEMQNFILDVGDQLQCPLCRRKFTADQLNSFNISEKK